MFAQDKAHEDRRSACTFSRSVRSTVALFGTVLTTPWAIVRSVPSPKGWSALSFFLCVPTSSKRSPTRLPSGDFAHAGGCRFRFPGSRLFPRPYAMRDNLLLSAEAQDCAVLDTLQNPGHGEGDGLSGYGHSSFYLPVYDIVIPLPSTNRPTVSRFLPPPPRPSKDDSGLASGYSIVTLTSETRPSNRFFPLRA